MTAAANATLIDKSPDDILDAYKLNRRIDELLAQYLELLDEYTQARALLQKQLSSGFIALADAKFTAPPGVKYGQDFYDDRMQALCTVNVDQATASSLPTIGRIDNQSYHVKRVSMPLDRLKAPLCSSSPEPKILDQSEGDAQKTDTPASEDGDGTGSDRESNQTAGSQGGVVEKDVHQEDAEAAEPKTPPDPLRWFGVFVSPKLKKTQSNFSDALKTIVDEVVNLDLAMLSLEIEIRRHRKYRAKLVK